MASRSHLTIDLKAIQANYRMLDNLSHNDCKTAISIKADAYGLGAGYVAPALYDVGARNFFVATIDEGIKLRGVLQQAKIYILNGFMACDKSIYIEYNLIPILNSLEKIKLYQDLTLSLSHELHAVIHFDTGINRLGLPAYEAEILYNDPSLLNGINLKYVMSHFSSSDEKDNPANEDQYQQFLKITQKFKGVKKSLCNSGGVFLSKKYHMDLTRTGIALYGGNPTPYMKNKMQAVVSLKAPVLQVKNVKKGEKSGYNGTHRFDSDSRIAIISIGYADGLLRSLSNVGFFYYKGYKMPIRGRISMDVVICDLSDIPNNCNIKVGDMVEIIGKDQSLDDLAKSAGTIPYEILTSLGNRYMRSYIK